MKIDKIFTDALIKAYNNYIHCRWEAAMMIIDLLIEAFKKSAMRDFNWDLENYGYSWKNILKWLEDQKEVIRNLYRIKE